MAADGGPRRTKAASCRSGRLAAAPARREEPARPAHRGSSGVYRNGHAAPRDMPGLQLAWPMQARATRPRQRRPMRHRRTRSMFLLARGAAQPPLRPTAPIHGHAAVAKAAVRMDTAADIASGQSFRGAPRRPFPTIAGADRVVAGCIASLSAVACRAVLLPLQHRAPVEVPDRQRAGDGLRRHVARTRASAFARWRPPPSCRRNPTAPTRLRPAKTPGAVPMRASRGQDEGAMDMISHDPEPGRTAVRSRLPS